jgi:alanyl-tRNA synthetase
VLGQHARQAGSLVAPDRLRFDFTHPEALTLDELERIEAGVNRDILNNYHLDISFKPLAEAIEGGAIALFGEKYGETVRNITIGGAEPFSNELCGGTHVEETGDIGVFLIISEGSTAAGIRRIEAVTGRRAYELIQSRFSALKEVANRLGTAPEGVSLAVETLQEDLSTARKQINIMRQNLVAAEFTRVLDDTQSTAGVDVLTATLSDVTTDTLRQMVDRYRHNRPQNAVAVLASVVDGRPLVVAGITEDLVQRGLHAGELVKFVAKPLGGGGGGKPTLAQAGGKDAARLEGALASVHTWVEDHLD